LCADVDINPAAAGLVLAAHFLYKQKKLDTIGPECTNWPHDTINPIFAPYCMLVCPLYRGSACARTKGSKPSALAAQTSHTTQLTYPARAACMSCSTDDPHVQGQRVQTLQPWMLKLATQHK
jgi:hypothetical protein